MTKTHWARFIPAHPQIEITDADGVEIITVNYAPDIEGWMDEEWEPQLYIDALASVGYRPLIDLHALPAEYGFPVETLPEGSKSAGN